MEVLIGIDPHKATNALAAIDEGGKLLEYAVFSTNRAGLRSLIRWGKRFPERCWAVEGAGGLGRAVALRLVATGERVVDVPAKLSLPEPVFSPRATPARTIRWTPFMLPWPPLGMSVWPMWVRRSTPRDTEDALRKTGGPHQGTHPHPQPPACIA